MNLNINVASRYVLIKVQTYKAAHNEKQNDMSKNQQRRTF